MRVSSQTRMARFRARRERGFRKVHELDRFCAFVQSSGGHLIWTGGPQFRLGDGRQMGPKQASYFLYYGEASQRSRNQIDSICGLRDCVNPLHLVKTRGGPDALLPRLTPEDMALLATMQQWPEGTGPAMARRYGVHVGTIYKYRYEMRAKDE